MRIMQLTHRLYLCYYSVVEMHENNLNKLEGFYCCGRLSVIGSTIGLILWMAFQYIASA